MKLEWSSLFKNWSGVAFIKSCGGVVFLKVQVEWSI